MSKPTTIPTALVQLAAERNRMAYELRAIADELEALAIDDVAEVLVALSALAEELRRTAKLWVKSKSGRYQDTGGFKAGH